MRTSFVERLLAQVDGAVATIWITVIFVLDALPEAAALDRAAAVFQRETPNLNRVWRPLPEGWRGAAPVCDGLSGPTRAADLRGFAEALIAAPLDLGVEVPFRVRYVRCDDGTAAVALQLHHAAGDGRALMFASRRFWALVRDPESPTARLGAPGFCDRGVASWVARAPMAALGVLNPASRVLARRGHALARRGPPSSPRWAALSASRPGGVAHDVASGLFYAALVNAAYAVDADLARRHPLRLRVPVDLRAAMGLGPAIENACSAVPIELDRARVEGLVADPAAYAARVPEAIREALGRGVHRATALECLVASKLADAARLRAHVRPDLEAPVRANTLVTTYVGRADRYTDTAASPMRAVLTHTPTLGANGLTHGGALMFNLSAFAPMWSRDDLDRALDAATRCLEDHFQCTVTRWI